MGQDDPKFGTPTPQAVSSSEILSLYNWWKHERPQRLDPMEESGLKEYYNS